MKRIVLIVALILGILIIGVFVYFKIDKQEKMNEYVPNIGVEENVNTVKEEIIIAEIEEEVIEVESKEGEQPILNEPKIDNFEEPKEVINISKPAEEIDKNDQSVKEDNIVIEQPKEEEEKVTNEVIKPNEPEIIIPAEEYRINQEKINQMINIINNNQSQDMITYGYEVTTDSSITSITSPFTFSELRVKNALTWKFGSIRIYAQDYYRNGEYVTTYCYII